MTEGERRRERAMAMGVGTDVMTAAPMLVIGICSGSLTLLADAIRGGLLTLLELFAYVMMRRIHRGRLPSYQYGCGKIESFLNALIGGALVLSSIWVFGRGVLSMLHPPEPSPLGLAAAAAIAAVNVAQNAWMFVTFLRARRVGASILIDGQVKTRILKLASSIVATLAILTSAIFAGEVSGRVADLVGSAVVTQVMLWTAYELIAAALPDLMDRMLDHSQLTLINRVLFCNFDRIEAIHHLRTRRSGVTKHIEIGLSFAADRRRGEVDAINQSLKSQLESQIPDARVTIVALAAPSTSVRRHPDLIELAALARSKGVRREPAACDRSFALRRARFDRCRVDQEARAKGVDASSKAAYAR
jgi:cation diffusion facilitator family transporter